MTTALSAEDALVAVMISVSAADADMKDAEMRAISAIVELMPVFGEYDRGRIGMVSDTVVELLSEDEGLETLLGLVRDALPEGDPRETAYALACDVAAADGAVPLAEMRFLEMLRHTLGVSRLKSAAIERGARVRFIRKI
jgi:tellurite resistance protein